MRGRIWGFLIATFAALCVINTQPVYADDAQATVYSEDYVFTDCDELVKYLDECIIAHNETIVFIMSETLYVDSTARDEFSALLKDVAMYYETSGLSYTYSKVSGGTKFTVTPGYKFTIEQDNQLNLAIDNAIKSLNLDGKSEYQKVRLIHDYICDNVNYDFTYTKYTAYDAMMTGEAVCQGFANLFCRMCYKAGLDVKLITGIGNGGGHAWNIVRIGDVYYDIDVTWDGQSDETRYTYFLKNEAEFIDHYRDEYYDTAEFNSEYPMAEGSWIDFSTVVVTESIDNLSTLYFNTIDGGTVSNRAENNRPKILLFGSAKGCTYTSDTFSGIASSDFSDVDVVYVDSNMATLDAVNTFKTNFGNGNSSIKYSYSVTYDNLSVMWDYVDALELDMQYFPLVVYIDANNKIQYAELSGFFSATHVRNIVDTYLFHNDLSSISATTATVDAKESIRLYVDVYGVDRNAQFFTWSSSDTSVATVDANGVVKGLKKGNVTITCKINNTISHTCKVTVNRAKIADGFNLGYDGIWAYYKNGVVDTSYTGMASNSYGWWYVKNGVLDRTYTGMAKNSYGWWYMKNGKLDRTYTGFVKNAYGYWYFVNGKLNKTYTGIVKNSAGLWYVKDGKIDWSYTGMTLYSGKWIYVKTGKYDSTYTGMAKNSAGWWYIKNGNLDRTYTGLATNSYGTWYMKNGRLDTSYSGKITFNGETYTIKKGKVV